MAIACTGIVRLNSLNFIGVGEKFFTASAQHEPSTTTQTNVAFVLSGCADTNYIQVSTTKLSTLLPSLPPTGPVYLEITGILTVDVNWNIPTGSDILFGEASGIDVQAGNFLNATGVDFRGCNDLWRGIHIQSNAYGKFYQCNFSDALYAIDYSNLSYMGIANCEFTNNFVGVRCNNSSDGLGYIYWASDDFQFINNKFVGGYLKNYSGSDSDFDIGGGKTYAGLLLNKISHFVVGGLFSGGVPYQYNNQFKNGIFGILSNESSITVTHSSFGNNVVGLQEIATEAGHFIKVLGGGSKLVDFRTHEYAAINVSGFDKSVLPVDFTSFDVSLQGSDINVENTKFNSTTTITPVGIRMEGLYDKEIYISQNSFNDYLEGIIATGTGGLEQYEIVNNTYQYVTYYSGNNVKRFFQLLKSTPNYAGEVKCTGNSLTAGGNFYGIELYELVGAEILNNTIECSFFNQDEQFYGINLSGCSSSTVNGNTIEGPGKNYLHSIAYSFGSSKGNFNCNSSNGTYEGMRFDFDSYPSRVYSNHFYDHYNGFVLDNLAIIGVQDNHQNQWYGNPYDGDGALMGKFYSSFPFAIGASKFYITTSIPVQTNKYWPNYVSYDLPHSNNGVGSWFQSKGTQKPECVSVGENLTDTLHQLSYITEQDRYIAKGDSLKDDVASWGLRWGLYDKLYNAPSLISTDTLTGAFYSHENSGNLGKIFEIKYLIENLKNLPEFNTYREHHKDIISQKEALTEAELLVHTSLTPGAKDTAMQILNTQIAVLDSMLNESQALADDMQLAFSTAQAEMQSIRESLSNMNQIEQNYSIVYGIVIDHLNDTEFSLSQNETDSLYYVAEQCYGTGGRAVLDARHLLRILGLEASYDDDCFIEPRGGGRQYDEEPSTSIDIIYTNPASRLVKYQIKGEYTDGGMEIIIINLTGNVVGRELLTKNKGEFDISSLSSGLYMLVCRVGKEIATHKLVVQY